VTALGPQRIEGLDTSGYEDKTTFAITQATGSCRGGTFAFDMRSYYSKLAVPRTSCPIVAGRGREKYPQAPVNMVASGGCRPTFTAHKSGPVPPAGNLALYQTIAFSLAQGATPAPAASPAGAAVFLTERGNVRSLGPTDATLFDIPKDFTKAP